MTETIKAKKKILICENDNGIRDVLELIFETSGFEVSSVINSSEIYFAIANYRPDVLILDTWKPGYNVSELLQEIRDKLSLPIRIVAISTSRSDEYLSEEDGIDVFIPKPFDMEMLLKTVEYQLGSLDQNQGYR